MRLIDADALIEKYGTWYTEEGTEEGFIGTLKSLIDKVPTIEPEQRWIPCEEQLPDEDILTGRKKLSAEVLMTVVNTIDDETIIDYGSTINGEWYSDRTECFIPHFWKVVAWMPLPEPYQEECGK